MCSERNDARACNEPCVRWSGRRSLHARFSTITIHPSRFFVPSETRAMDDALVGKKTVCLLTLPRAKGAGMFKLTLRPTERRDPPGDDVEVTVTEDDATRKGAKRKRAPPTKGPCEHGVKWRSKCKVCGACPHGRQRRQCKECGGSSICEHGRKCAVGLKSASTVVSAICARVRRVSICEHGRRRSDCKECGGASICEHGRHRSYCKECGGASICEHGRRRSARCAAGLQSASTVVGATRARIAVGGQSASTVVSVVTARSAVVHQSASTVVSALSARSAVGLNLRARSSASLLQGVRRVCNLRARS